MTETGPAPAAEATPVDPAAVGAAIARLDAWLETMRGPGGYTGPVSHWWESCWLYTGPMIDWRYEGIICGYVELFRKGGDERWLDRAVRAGEDAVAAQTPDGHFGNSSFQHGAQPGGTPHEAAVDVALLELARVLREHGRSGWERFAACAERNIERYLLPRLWAGDGFADQPWHPVRVPNKNATTMEAMLLAEEVLGRRDWLRYVQPAAEVVLRQQVTIAGPRQGATVHAGTGRHALAIGIYTARCVGALRRLAARSDDDRYWTAARDGARFLARQVTPRGSRFGYYRDGRAVMAPEWISPSGDLLRALLGWGDAVEEAAPAATALARTLLRAQYPTGGLPTAFGFAVRGSTRPHVGPPELRDVLPVVGWCDKTWRALAQLSPGTAIPAPSTGRTAEIPCTWRGAPCLFREDDGEMQLLQRRNGRQLYRWRKGQPAPDVYAL